MFRIISSSRRLCLKPYPVIIQHAANYIRGYWPEPITQQTLTEFLRDINYFEEPRDFKNIGKDTGRATLNSHINLRSQNPTSDTKVKDDSVDVEDVDKVLELLSEEAKLPPFDIDDAVISSEQLMSLAITSGIYRDLFGSYSPDKNDIRFTPEQAKNLDRLIPHHWITDQPYARVERNPKRSEPLNYFEPIVGVSCRFVHEVKEDNKDIYEQYAHTVYHGNIIPASEALVKPSITLDGHLLSGDLNPQLKDSQYGNWKPGQVSLANFEKPNDRFYSIALINLDSLHPDSANLHWMISNISLNGHDTQETLQYDEICEYLPVFGIQGFGYSRYVVLVMEQSSKIDTEKHKISDFSLQSRRFDAKSFITENNLTPVGLSWFQTVWDDSSNKIFHDYLNMRAPVYEHVQSKLEKFNQGAMYPGRVPFNIYLDHLRDKKEINQQVLLERLRSVDPFDYRDQYVPPKLPPTVFDDDEKLAPSWMKQVLFKKKNKIGYWRGLRPVSKILPLNNNADLDYPLKPIESSKKSPPGFPNSYNHHVVKFKIKKIKDLPYSKPVNEHHPVYIEDDHEVHLDSVRKMMNEEFKPHQSEDSQKKTSKFKSTAT